jgi:addiction module HigA family antidote
MENRMPPVHPGEILKEELIELGLSANAFAKALGVPTNRITMILKGQRGISADTALRLSRYFGMSPQFWMNLQQSYELKIIEETNGTEIKRAVKPRAA